MRIDGKTVLLQQGGDAGEQKAVLKDAAGQDDRQAIWVECLALEKNGFWQIV